MTWNYYHNTNNKSSPAPFLDVTINFRGSRKSITVPMLIDTGSFQTILPLHILKDDLFATQLKGKPFEVKGYDGITKKHPIFIVDLIIQENTIPKKKVLGINKKTPLGQTPYGLLGRDILSRYMLRCDGPAQKFELELPSP